MTTDTNPPEIIQYPTPELTQIEMIGDVREIALAMTQAVNRVEARQVQMAEQVQWCVNQVYVMMNSAQALMANMNSGMLGKMLMKGMNNDANSEEH